MSQPQSTKRRVLFVDDDPRFLDMIQKVMNLHSQGNWEVLVAESASQALGLLQGGPVDLVAIDVQMPVVDGLQFLTLLNRRYPDLSKVVLTGFASEAYRVACLSNGAELFLEKPMTAADQLALHAALTRVMNAQPEQEEGFRGVLRRVGLADVIQMECLSVGSSILEISGARGSGRIYIQDGAIVHAEAGSRQGEAALQALLSLRGGEFRLEPFQAPPSLTIDAPWEFLLMEAAQKRDESGGETGIEDRAPGSPPATLPVLPPVDWATSSLDTAQPVPSEGAQTGPQPSPAFEEQPEHPPVTGLRRAIEEVLVCANDGTVLHEWQVRNSDLWVNFIEFLSQKGRRVGQGLPLGSFERFEAAEGDLRLIAVVGNDRGVLVRCREETD
jgi:CheY-like chemotaxis protein